MYEEMDFTVMCDIVRKAAMFDLIGILENMPEKSYTVPEWKQMIRAYIAGKEK